nr:uncharacterized protein LOC113808044 [Penaeus vannamei]
MLEIESVVSLKCVGNDRRTILGIKSGHLILCPVVYIIAPFGRHFPGHSPLILDQQLFKPLDIEITLGMLRKTPCWNEYVIPEDGKDSVLQNYFNHPSQFLLQSQDGKAYEPGYVKTDPKIVNCDDIIVLDEVDLEKKLVMKSDADAEEAHLEAARAVSGDTAATSEIAPVVKSGLSESDISAGGAAQTKHPVAILPFDGVYLLVVHTAAVPESVIGNDSYIAEIDIEMRSDYGYLSAVGMLE